MALFRKKQDPISERARELNAKIAALQTEIKKLSTQAPAPGAPPVRQSPQATPSGGPPPVQSGPAPRLRSTALPHGPTISPTSASPPATPREPIFEELDQERLKKEPEPKPQPPNLASGLGMRRNGLFALWDRFKQSFRGPATSNPKLVNYLAAGSIQGLRPLRYEKRIARNRFIVLAAFLILLLWGILAMLFKHK